jgi:hypothetical protein
LTKKGAFGGVLSVLAGLLLLVGAGIAFGYGNMFSTATTNTGQIVAIGFGQGMIAVAISLVSLAILSFLGAGLLFSKHFTSGGTLILAVGLMSPLLAMVEGIAVQPILNALESTPVGIPYSQLTGSQPPSFWLWFLLGSVPVLVLSIVAGALGLVSRNKLGQAKCESPESVVREAPAPQQVACRTCGFIFPASTKFCSNCGAKL